MAKAYRSTLPYRKPVLYNGSAYALPVAGWGMAATYRHGWDASSPGASVVGAPSLSVSARADINTLRWDALQTFRFSHRLLLQRMGAGSRACASRWTAQGRYGAAVAWRFEGLVPEQLGSRWPWGDYEGKRANAITARHRASVGRARALHLHWSALAARALSDSLLWRSLIRRGAYVALPWGPMGARTRSADIRWPVEPNPQPGVITVPQLPVYVMLPTLSAVRLPDRTPVPLLGISVEGSLDSWAWTFSAPMAITGAGLIEANGGEPTELEVAINGHVWTFIAEAVDDNRRFGSRTLTVRGRSRSAELGAPYAPVRTFTESADTLAAQLATNEVANTGWTLVWDAVDWLVPGGTFSYQDLAPIDAIAQVASSIGATVMSDPEAKEIRVASSYPTSPWAWSAGTPYAILPASILTAGDSSWEGGTNADGVYVYAENAASGALVKLTGSAGSNQLPMIVERLAVHADAQRERGRAELAAAGKKRRVNRTYPLFPTPAPSGQPDLGLLPLGALVEVEDTDGTWRGQVMAVRVDAQRSGSALSVRQHLTIERQYR